MGLTGASHPGVSNSTHHHYTGGLLSAYYVLGVAVNSSHVLISPSFVFLLHPSRR